ncbi:ATP-binding cassette domain-containing protein [Exiguobacterium sp. H66]|uniref:ATP-binding cassette domain-containing protein n=1 Tax=Exiguobacterium sp. H66 TaxID=2751208 RepID=UPI001BE62F61|nr:ATP-binding cassette domain-containing protein [Exiguobacterium sp. H66]
MPTIISNDSKATGQLERLAAEAGQPIIYPERLLHGRVRDLLATTSLFVAGELTTLLGLEPFFEREVSELSSGEQQLVSVGYALASLPPSLFLDNPFLFLDHVRKRRLVDLLSEMERRFTCRIYYSVTDQADLEQIVFEEATQGDIYDEMRAVEHRYPMQTRYALDVSRLSLAAGERVVLVGANGSGKSTLLRLLLGVERPLYGKVKRRGRKNYLPAHPALAPQVDSRLGTFASQKQQLFERLDWSDDAYYFDEPTAGLTDAQRQRFVETLVEQPMKLVVMATHDDFLIRHATRVLYLVQGEIAFDGPAATFLEQSRLYGWD